MGMGFSCVRNCDMSQYSLVAALKHAADTVIARLEGDLDGHLLETATTDAAAH